MGVRRARAGPGPSEWVRERAGSKKAGSAEDSRRACLIEIIEAPAKVLRLPVGGPLWGKYVLRIGQAASLDLAARLGLPADTDIPVHGAFWSQFDFSMTSAKRVWGIP